MKFSRYNLFFPQDRGDVLAYNSLTGAFLVIRNEVYEVIRKTDGTATDLSLSLRSLLTEFGFLIPDEADELLRIRKEMFAQRYRSDIVALTLAPTLACNLRCIYCYEGSIARKGTMSEEVQGAVEAYVLQKAPSSRSISISWYGGEPLLCPETVIGLSKRLRNIAQERNVPIHMGLVTNGTLLSQQIVNDLSELGFGTMQITLDGPMEVNDRRKPFASGTGSSFLTVTHNLTSIDFGKIRVDLRCNIDKTNADSAAELIPEVQRLGLREITVYPAPVTAWPGVVCQDAHEMCFSEEDFVGVRRAFEARAKEYGYRITMRPVPRRHYCGGDIECAYTVGPDGSLYKCWNHIGDPSLAVGSLLFGRMTVNPVADWPCFDPTSTARCSQCSILPLCMGGCPEKARVEKSRHCERWRYEMQRCLADWAAEAATGSGQPC